MVPSKSLYKACVVSDASNNFGSVCVLSWAFKSVVNYLLLTLDTVYDCCRI